MGKKCVDLVKIAVFLLIMVFFVYLLDRILANGTDNHKYLFRDFYRAPANEVDVVYMGPSLSASRCQALQCLKSETGRKPLFMPLTGWDILK